MLVAAGATMVALAVWINHDYYKVSAIFAAPSPTQVDEAIERARGVTWWHRYMQYADVVRRPVDAGNAQAYWRGMHDAACLMVDPLFQSDLPVALAHLGRIEQAQRVLYVQTRLAPERLPRLRQQLAGQGGPAFERLRVFMDQPHPVAVAPGDILSCLR